MMRITWILIVRILLGLVALLRSLAGVALFWRFVHAWPFATLFGLFMLLLLLLLLKVR
jgi:hypothetical protein